MTIKELYEKKMQEMQEERFEEMRVYLLFQQKLEYERRRVKSAIQQSLDGLFYNFSDDFTIQITSNPPVVLDIDTSYKNVKYSDDCDPVRKLVTDIRITCRRESVITGLSEFEDTLVKFLITHNIEV